MIARQIALILGVGIVYPLVAQAGEPPALKTLEAKDLHKLLNSFAIPQESELGKQMRTADTAKKRLLDAQHDVQTQDAKVADKQKTIVEYLKKRRELRAQLNMTRNVDVHNNIVNALNELGDRIMLMQQSEEEEKAANAARATLNQLTEEYVEQILAARKLHDETKTRYDELAKDEEVRKAIDEYNQATGKKMVLGPTPTFMSYQRKLKSLEDAVLTEEIALRRGEGNLWFVNVVFDGKHTQEMAIDTGASIIALPAQVATAAGLSPKSDDPVVQLHMADGHVVEGHTVFASKVRVGKFTAEHVECAVMPAEFTNAAPLLGLSFLRRFTFKIDADRAKLVMSRVEAGEPTGKTKKK
jgi:clan AA aspartic protease (TIGR02281 family)